MVLYQAIINRRTFLAPLITLVALASALSARAAQQESINVPAATEKARSFLREVFRDRMDTPHVRMSLLEDPKVEKNGATLSLEFTGCGFSFAKDGSIVAVSIRPDKYSDDERYSEAEAKDLALRYGRLLDVDHRCEVVDVRLGNGNCGAVNYEIELSPIVDGISFSFLYRTTIFIDRATGVPVNMWIAKAPQVRRASGQLIEKGNSHNNLVNDLQRFGTVPHIRISDAELAWIVPNFQAIPNEMTSEHQAAAKAGEAILVYQYSVYDADSWSSDLKKYTGGVAAYVDAHTGRTIAFWEPKAFVGGGGGRTVGMSWPTEWTGLSLLGPKQVVKSGSAISTKGPKAEIAGQLRVLSIGKDIYKVKFSEKEKLIWMEHDGKRLYGKPNASLLKALKSVKSEELKPFGQKANAKKS